MAKGVKVAWLFQELQATATKDETTGGIVGYRGVSGEDGMKFTIYRQIFLYVAFSNAIRNIYLYILY